MSRTEVKAASSCLNSPFEDYLLSCQKFKLCLENFRLLIVEFYGLFGGRNGETVNESLSDSFITARRRAAEHI